MADAGPFPQDALEANAAGRLSAQQRTWIQSLARAGRRASLSLAGVAGVMAFLVLFFADRGGTTRVLIGVGLLILAGLLFVRGISGSDPVDADLRAGTVESVEGAIAKRKVVTHNRSSSTTTYYIDVENKQLVAFRDQYDAAPEAGYVRVYYVPHSLRVVNLEHLPDHAIPDGVMGSPRDMMKIAAAGLIGFDEVKKAEARAELAAIGHQVMPENAAPPAPDARDPRPLAQAIIGKWTNGMATLEFNADGTASLGMMGREQRGDWSVDANGRLVAGLSGGHEATDAWVASGELTITIGGNAMKFKRA